VKVDELTWDKPGAGQWTWDGSHLAGAPTPLQQKFHFPNLEAGLGAMFERYGIPLRTYSYRVVNGKVYARLLPLVGAEKEATKVPPAPVLWMVTRLLPEFRKRNRNARRALEQKVWRDELKRWQTEQRQYWFDANVALQDEPIADFDDNALADHIRRAFDHAGAGHKLHFELHGTDLAPLGDLMVHCRAWNIAPNEAMALLEGSSPASSSAATALAHLGKLVADAPQPPQSLDDVRALGPAAADALDAYLREFGWRVVTNYDVDGLTLNELPSAVLGAIRAAAAPRAEAEPDAALYEQLRTRVPETDRPTFDDLVAESRTVYGLRDENGPLTIEWPVGLLRRAVLEAGRRFQQRGALHAATDALELDVDELTQLLVDGRGPTADDVRARGARRAELAVLQPPVKLGDDEPEPPLSLMPAALARVAAIAMTAVENLDAPAERELLTGLGVGEETYIGRARVAHDAYDVLETLEDGDVLVTTFTNPAYNSVLLIAGAVVCEEGGALSHAAVMARELGIPAVIGARGAMSEIHDGDTVEVDPVNGRVRVVQA
jgi:pyruvate,water dikinase